MDADIAVVGAGIAGAAVAYELASTHRVVLIERESQPGYHATGRSAALYTETYGPRAIRALARASRPFLAAPPAGFERDSLLCPRGVLMVATAAQEPRLRDFLAEARALGATHEALGEISLAEALRFVPVLDPNYVRHACHEPFAMDIDVHALHQGFLRGLRARGGRILLDAPMQRIGRIGSTWRISTPTDDLTAGVVVNAAGAWADEVATLAGVRPLGLVPKRRTALIFDAPPATDIRAWPMVCCIAETFYFKPDAGRILASPADETPSPPCDAQPEDIDVAHAIDRVERATTMRVRRIARKWSGLRSFVPDKTPVAGPDDTTPGFFWLAGQGGYGIKTSPALARVVATQIRGDSLPGDLARAGISFEDLAAARLRGQRNLSTL